MKILFLPRYSDVGASSRYRIYNYLEFYKKNGIGFVISPLFDPQLILKVNNSLFYKAVFSISNYFRRIIYLLKKNDYDFYYLGGDMLPYFPYFLEKILLKKKKYIIDLDDALFHNYDLNKNLLVRFFTKTKFENLIKNASHIITGSEYLTEYALKYNSNVTEIPTSINLGYYLENRRDTGNVFTIGWIGSATTSRYILEIVDSLKKFGEKYKYEIRLIGFDRRLESKLKDVKYKIIEWSAETEVLELVKIDVGIMPLDVTPWSKGKCGFKLIQYMACAKPTISTPLKANINIDNGNGNLFAENEDEWLSCLETVYLNKKKYHCIGELNLQTVRSKYSVEANQTSYVKIFKTI